MLIVAGLGRCGTSFMMKFLEKSGFYLGKNISWNNQMRAGYEFAPAYAINRDLYTDFICKGREIDLDEEIETPYWGKISYKERILRFDKDDVKERPQGGKIQAIKDPRFTWHPLLIRCWWSVRKDLKLLILHRNFKEVNESRKKLGEGGQDPKTERIDNLDQYRIDFADFITEVMALGIPFETLFFPNFLRHPMEVVTKLERLGHILLHNQACEHWLELVDYSLVTSS